MNSQGDIGIKLQLLLAVIILTALLLTVLKLLLPWLLVIAALWLGGKLGVRWHEQRQHRKQSLHQTFYKLLKQHQGRIRVIDFSIANQMPGDQAKAYLDQQAQVFSATFEATHYGDIVYVFPVSSPPTSSEDIWRNSAETHTSEETSNQTSALTLINRE